MLSSSVSLSLTQCRLKGTGNNWMLVEVFLPTCIDATIILAYMESSRQLCFILLFSILLGTRANASLTPPLLSLLILQSPFIVLNLFISFLPFFFDGIYYYLIFCTLSLSVTLCIFPLQSKGSTPFVKCCNIATCSTFAKLQLKLYETAYVFKL